MTGQQYITNDLVAEDVAFTATDKTDGIVLPGSAKTDLQCGVGGERWVGRFPGQRHGGWQEQRGDHVKLEDKLARLAPGKLVSISQGSGHSVIKGPIPSVTVASGEV